MAKSDCRLPGSDQIVDICKTTLPRIAVFANDNMLCDSYTFKNIQNNNIDGKFTVINTSMI